MTPGLLYKYVTAKRALACLPEVGDGALRATQPVALNDPFECHVWKPFIDRDLAEGNQRLANVLTELHETVPVTKEQVAEAQDAYGSMYMRELLAQQMSRRFGIISFATDPLHPVMWSHYTVDGSGFVIGYRIQKLCQLAGDGERLRKVIYSSSPIPLRDYVVAVFPESNIFKLLCHKSSHWQYEEEWRLIVDLDKTIGTGKSDRHGQPINVLQVPNSAVAEVYYTERTSICDVSKIERRLASANNRYGVMQPTKLVLSDTTFSYKSVVC